MLDEVGLSKYLDRNPDELSGGMKKRLAFARCFAAIPEAVLLDEPFVGLDKGAREALWSKLSNLILQHPVPVIAVTHFPAEVPDALPSRLFTLTGRPARISV